MKNIAVILGFGLIGLTTTANAQYPKDCKRSHAPAAALPSSLATGSGQTLPPEWRSPAQAGSSAGSSPPPLRHRT